jgi:antitoxin VapB
MKLNIKNPETDKLARLLAAETGETITAAVKQALRERLQLVRDRRKAEIRTLQAVGGRKPHRSRNPPRS